MPAIRDLSLNYKDCKKQQVYLIFPNTLYIDCLNVISVKGIITAGVIKCHPRNKQIQLTSIKA